MIWKVGMDSRDHGSGWVGETMAGEGGRQAAGRLRLTKDSDRRTNRHLTPRTEHCRRAVLRANLEPADGRTCRGAPGPCQSPGRRRTRRTHGAVIPRMEGLTTTTTEVNNNQAKDTEARTGLLVTEPEQWLCVAKLPRDTTEQEFRDILADFGKVADSFLMVSDKTGEAYFRIRLKLLHKSKTHAKHFLKQFANAF